MSFSPSTYSQPLKDNIASPWGIASGAEDAGEYPRFVPMLNEAGISWVRYFAEWRDIQPAAGQWRWEWSDNFVGTCRENQISVAGVFLYFAPWASADGKDTRAFPVKDMARYREYVRETAKRYKDDVRYWEVWNEMNSPAFNRGGSTRDYAEMVRAAYEEVKAIDPGIKIGITCAAYDLNWLDQVIRDGAAGHFDYLCVHPYNSIGLVEGTEQSFLALRGSARKMLDANQQRADIEIWVSEIGLTTKTGESSLRRQADVLVKSYVLGLAQGFERFCWFEAVGGVYGDGVHAIIGHDMKPFPAYHALGAMTKALGRRPIYQGWVTLGEGVLAFVFESPETGPTAAIWSSGSGETIEFHSAWDGIMSTVTGDSFKVLKGTVIQMDNSPAFISRVPDSLLAEARSNRDKPQFPSFAKVDAVSVKLGAKNESHGLRQGNIDPRPDGTTLPGEFQGVGYRSTDRRNKRPFMYFEVDRSFMDWDDAACQVTVVARRADPTTPARIRLVYESKTGYHEFGKKTPWHAVNTELLPLPDAHEPPVPWDLEAGEGWQTMTWEVRDARFIGKWGWNFQVNVEDSAGDVWVREVQVKRLAQ